MANNSFFMQLSNQSGIEMQRWWVNTYYGKTTTYSASMNGVLLQHGGTSYGGGMYSSGSGGVNVQVFFVDPAGNLWATPGWTYIKIPTELPAGSASVCQIQIGAPEAADPTVRPLTARWAKGGEPLQTSFYIGDKPTPATVRILGPVKVSPAVLYLANKAGDPLPGLELPEGGAAQVQVFHVSDLLNPKPENVTAQATLESTFNAGVCSVSKASDGLTVQAQGAGVTNVSVTYNGYSNSLRVAVGAGRRS